MVSVIVPTWNRRDLLRKTIESLTRQTAPFESFELIVVDDGSTDGTDAMVAGMRESLPFHFVFHRMEKNGGPVHARNYGAQLARGRILAFTDSDCQASPQWVARIIEVFAQDPWVAFLSGPAFNVPDQRVRFFSVGGNDLKTEHPAYPAANAIYRRDVFEEVGGFDPSAFLYNAGPTPLDCSDVDIAWRVKEHGYRNRFVDDLVIYHEVRYLTPLQWLAHYSRLMTIPLLVRRHPGFGKMMLWWGPFCLPENPLFYLAVAGLILSAVNPWFLILTVPFLLRLAWLLGGFSLVRLPLLVVQLGFLTLRQAVICGSLIYGSIRSRTVVL